MLLDLLGVDVSQLEQISFNHFQRGVYYMCGHQKKKKFNLNAIKIEFKTYPTATQILV